jgi:hypothetical protein
MLERRPRERDVPVVRRIEHAAVQARHSGDPSGRVTALLARERRDGLGRREPGY